MRLVGQATPCAGRGRGGGNVRRWERHRACVHGGHASHLHVPMGIRLLEAMDNTHRVVARQVWLCTARPRNARQSSQVVSSLSSGGCDQESVIRRV